VAERSLRQLLAERAQGRTPLGQLRAAVAEAIRSNPAARRLPDEEFGEDVSLLAGVLLRGLADGNPTGIDLANLRAAGGRWAELGVSEHDQALLIADAATTFTAFLTLRWAGRHPRASAADTSPRRSPRSSTTSRPGCSTQSPPAGRPALRPE
jgi:hypothetical protein